MATTIDRYAIEVDTQSAERSMRRLQTATRDTDDIFIKFRTTLATIGLGAFIGSALQLSRSIVDLSDRTGIAIDTILSFSRSLQTMGLTQEQAADAVSKFTLKIGQALTSSRELRFAFQQAGISLEELTTLSEQDLFTQMIQNLGEMQDKTRAAAIAAQLLEESGAKIDFSRAARDQILMAQSSKSSADAMRTAAQVSRDFEQIITALKLTVLQVVQPLVSFTQQLMSFTNGAVTSSEAIQSLARALGDFVKYFAIIGGGLLVLSRIGPVIAAIVAAFRGLVTIVVEVTGFIGNLFRNFKLVAGQIAQLNNPLRGLGVVLTTLIEPFTKLGVGGAAALAAIAAAADGAWEKVKQLLGIDQATVPEVTQPQANVNNTQRTAVDLAAQLKAQLDAQVAAYRRQGQLTIEGLRIQRSQIGLQVEEINYQNTMNDLFKTYIAQYDQLLAKFRELRANPATTPAELAAVNQRILELNASYGEQANSVREIAQSIRDQETAIRLANQAAEFQLELIVRQADAQLQIRDYNRELSRSTEDLNRQFQQLNLTPLEAQIQNIQVELRRGLDDQIRDLQRIQNASNFQQIQEQIQTITSVTEQAIQDQSRLAQQSFEYQRSFAFGWRSAFREYAAEATNSAKVAESIFRKATQGMEDAIVNFAKTGKFNFRDFLNSILEDLLRSQVRQLMAQLFGLGSGSGSGLAASAGRLLGFANGGIIPTNQPVLVGERGPELLMGAAGSRVIPNNQLGGTQVIYNINAVDAASFKQMLARDPSFLFAVTEQGRKSLPQTRR